MDYQVTPDVMDFTEDFCYEVPIVKEGIENSHQVTDPKSSIINVFSFNKVYKENTQLKELAEKCLDESTPIIIDEDSEKDNDCTIIDNGNVDSHETTSKHSNSSYRESVFCYDEIHKENKQLTELIEKCLDVENATGMLRIINRTLIPIYKDANETFKKSAAFEKALAVMFKKLDTEPEKKFTHLKGLCELLKSSKIKKRVSLLPLKTNISEKISNNHIIPINEIPAKKLRINDIIDLDEDDDVQINCSSAPDIQINDVRSQVTDDKSSSVQIDNDYETHVIIDDTENDSDVQINELSEKVTEGKDDDDVILIDDENDNSNKENRAATRNSNKTIRCDTLNTKRTQKIDHMNNNESEGVILDLCNEDDDISNSNKVYNTGEAPELTPTHEISIKAKIDLIETKIAVCNEMIKELDEREVVNDNSDSPYVQSELYKARIVSLYQELCTITGTESFKRHKVRLKVAAGHPEGPVRCLEEFINESIDDSGNPPFPDLHDVVSCVRKANMLYKMQWSKKDIEAEARALFIHYGRTVQKRRQKREWRHLLTYVKEETPDPADEDPALQARLADNARVARMNEQELLDRFAQMENPDVLHNPELTIEYRDESENDSDYGSTSPIPSVSNLGSDTVVESNINSDRIRLNSYKECCNGNITNNVVIYNPWCVPDQHATPSGQTVTIRANYIELNRNVESSMAIIDSQQQNYAEAPECNLIGTVQNNLEVYSDVIDTQQNVEATDIDVQQNYEENFNIEASSNTIDTPQNSEVTHIETQQSLEATDIEIQQSLEDIDIKPNLEENCNIEASRSNVLDSQHSLEVTAMNSQQNLEITDSTQESLEVTDIDTHQNIKVTSIKPKLEENSNLETSTTNVINTEKNVDADIKPNLEVSIEVTGKSVMHSNEMNTNLEACGSHINTDIEDGRNLIENSEVPSNSEVCRSNRTREHETPDEKSTQTDLNSLIVKREPLDIPRMLERLGDNFTTTIMDIEDPFLIVEISDSSESDDEGID